MKVEIVMMSFFRGEIDELSLGKSDKIVISQSDL